MENNTDAVWSLYNIKDNAGVHSVLQWRKTAQHCHKRTLASLKIYHHFDLILDEADIKIACRKICIYKTGIAPLLSAAYVLFRVPLSYYQFRWLNLQAAKGTGRTFPTRGHI